MDTRRRFGGFPAALGLLLAPALLGAPRPGLADQEKVIADGREDYELHCAACHGPRGRGDGEMAELLVVAPTDLTRIADDAGGAFPFWRIYKVIEGREPVKGHETFQMPLFDNRFRRDESKPGYLPAHIRVLLLTHYVESLQAK